MKVDGNTTILEHCTRYRGVSPGSSGAQRFYMIIVLFDGEPDSYVTGTPHEAMKELKEYYQRDWKGTNRILPVHVFRLVDYATIDCQ